jgi:hypothetical protein
MATLQLRGRAASSIRVGKLIKDVLSGRLASEDGKLVHEAAIVDIHHVYKQQIKENNMLRRKKLKPMVYSSFVCQFRFAEKLGLVELVRKEDMLFPPPSGHLYTFRVSDANIGEISKRHIYKLTNIGDQDELSWTNLTQAYIQHWVAPQKAPEYEALKKPYKFSAIPSRDQMYAFREYLRTGSFVEDKETKRLEYRDRNNELIDLDDYSSKLGDWGMYFEDRQKVSPEKARYGQLSENVVRLTELLYERTIPNRIQLAIDLLANMILTLDRIHAAKQPAAEEAEERSMTLTEALHSLMDAEHKEDSLIQLNAALDTLDEEHYEGINDVRDAIQEYEELEREGLTSEEYKDTKEELFGDIDTTIDNIAEIGAENEEE